MDNIKPNPAGEQIAEAEASPETSRIIPADASDFLGYQPVRYATPLLLDDTEWALQRVRYASSSLRAQRTRRRRCDRLPACALQSRDLFGTFSVPGYNPRTPKPPH